MTETIDPNTDAPDARPLWRLSRAHCRYTTMHEPHDWLDGTDAYHDRVACWGEPARDPRTGDLARDVYEVGEVRRIIGSAMLAINGLPQPRDRAQQARRLLAVLRQACEQVNATAGEDPR